MGNSEHSSCDQKSLFMFDREQNVYMNATTGSSNAIALLLHLITTITAAAAAIALRHLVQMQMLPGNSASHMHPHTQQQHRTQTHTPFILTIICSLPSPSYDRRSSSFVPAFPICCLLVY
jgi:hypothetical protein